LVKSLLFAKTIAARTRVASRRGCHFEAIGRADVKEHRDESQRSDRDGTKAGKGMDVRR
jgi:hypothetical protein